MSLAGIIIALAAGFGLLFLGGEALVRGAAALGLRLGLAPVVTGLTIVAFGTSAPELAVSLRAALNQVEGLSLGNVVGSNICNIALVLGLIAVIRPPRIESRIVKQDVPVMIACSLALVVFLLDGQVSRTEGLVMVTGLIAYVLLTLRRARVSPAGIDREFVEALPAPAASVWRALILMGAGLALVIAGGELFVRGAAGVAVAAGVPPAIVGLTIVAVGTSLPEIATSMVASLRGYGDMAAGNLVGSNIFNILGILGLTATVTPVSRGAVSFTDLLLMVAVGLVVVPFMVSRSRVGPWEGSALLLIYAGYLAWLVKQLG